MTRCIVLAVGLLVVASSASACQKERGEGPTAVAPPKIAAASTDAIWAFAPAGTTSAMVVADGAFAPLLRSAGTVIASLATVNGGMEIVEALKRHSPSWKFDPFDPTTPARFGLDLAKGAAYFEGPAGRAVVVPLGDRAAFVQAFGKVAAGSGDAIDDLGEAFCSEKLGRYVCADSRASLAAVGASDTWAKQIATWPAAERGAIEMVLDRSLLEEEDMGAMFLTDPQGLRVAVALEQGAATVRARLLGTPGVAMAPLGVPLRLRDDVGAAPPGFLRVNTRMAFDNIKEMGSLPKGVDPVAYAAAFTGEVLGYVQAGAPPRGFLRIALRDPAPVKKLLEGCDSFFFPNVTVRPAGTGCELSTRLPTPAGEQDLRFLIWVEEDQVVVAIGDHTRAPIATPAVPHSPVAQELYRGDWTMALVGTGLMLPTADEVPLLAKAPRQIPLAVVSWIRAYLSEIAMGIGRRSDGIELVLRVRTLWSNPDDVVAAMHPLLGRIAQGDATAVAEVEALAAQHPDTPLAADIKATRAGPMVPISIAGMLAAVAIPAFTDYMQKSRSVEAQVMLRRLANEARDAYIEAYDRDPATARFPGPSAPATPPPGSCCNASSDGTCAPNSALWVGEPWAALDFSLDDPHSYSYDYTVTDDGQGFMVRAFGDLDCDGVYSTLTITGRGVGGFPVLELPVSEHETE